LKFKFGIPGKSENRWYWITHALFTVSFVAGLVQYNGWLDNPDGIEWWLRWLKSPLTYLAGTGIGTALYSFWPFHLKPPPI
jgi:hypothetical protein